MRSMIEALNHHVHAYTEGLASAMMPSTEAMNDSVVLGIDMSIEGLRSQGYSIGIFVFLIISLVLFSCIIYFYLPKKGAEKLKTGERIMFGAIILGIFIAVGIGWLQLIDGYLL